MRNYIPLLEEYQEYSSDVDRLLDKMSRGEELQQNEKDFMEAVSRNDWISAKKLQMLMQAKEKAVSDPQITVPVSKEDEDREYMMLWDDQMDRAERLGMLQGIGQPPNLAELRWSSLPPDIREMIKNFLNS